MVNDGGGARKEALQEERMLYVWDREEEGAPWRRGSVSAVCFKHKCFALSGTTDTPSEAVQDVGGCLCGCFFFCTSSEVVFGWRPTIGDCGAR